MSRKILYMVTKKSTAEVVLVGGNFVLPQRIEL